MPDVIAAAYGSWTSPITAVDLAASTHPVETGTFVGDEVWWSELRSDQNGRAAIRREASDGTPEDVLPAPWNARSRVHEYGGGAWAAADGVLVFVEFTDQRLYALPAGGAPRPLTPAGRGDRFGELSILGDHALAIREHHDDTAVRRDIVAVPLDGSAADDPERVVSIVSGSRFLAYPRVSPDGRRLAWIAWDHPRMPWDGTELRVGELDDDFRVSTWRTLAGSEIESVLQPEWFDSETLIALSDRTGWWNPYRLDLDGRVESLHSVSRDIGGPLWSLGTRWYQPLDDGRLALTSTLGTTRLDLLDPVSGEVATLDLPFTSLTPCASSGGRLLLRCGSSTMPGGLRVVGVGKDEPEASVTDIRLDLDELPDPGYLPIAEPATFQGPQREVHAFVYPPRNPRYRGLPDELPPYIAFVHGGPTGHVQPALNLVYAFFTSRGLGVVDVNYGGSTGYGREYRERLRGQWGVVDVEDTVAAVTALADAGRADRDRLAIEGGSAGGWTVLAALTGTDVFAAGTSYYGVAELTEFAQETHDFESRYLDDLVGPLPAAEDLYAERAPLNHVDELSVPVLLLQGADDPIVPPAQAERFRDALAAKGIPHAYILYPGESHGFRRAETIVSAREAELSFYGQVFGFDPPGIPRLPLAP